MKRQVNSERLLNFRTYIGIIAIFILAISSGIISLMLEYKNLNGLTIVLFVFGFFLNVILLKIVFDLVRKLNKEAKILDDTG